MLNIAVCQVHKDKTKIKYVLNDIRIYEINSMDFFTCFFFFFFFFFIPVGITQWQLQPLVNKCFSADLIMIF